MKKLFFTALVAMVAVGGAFATNSRIFAAYYPQGQNTASIVCNPGPAICSEETGFDTGYTVPFSSGQQSLPVNQVNLATIPSLDL